MTFKEAKKELKKVGASHAQNDALRAMYAELVTSNHGGGAEKYFLWLQSQDGTTETDIRHAVLPLLWDRATAWDILLQ
jgi:2-phosphoglycerate kinase